MKTCALCGLVEGGSKKFFYVKVGWIPKKDRDRLLPDDRDRPHLVVMLCEDCSNWPPDEWTREA